MNSGYMVSSRPLDEAIGEVAVDDADQAERDRQALVNAVREERIKDG